MTEHAERQYGAACVHLHRLVEEHGASLPPLMREAMEMTARLYVAEWLAARAAAMPTPEEQEGAPSRDPGVNLLGLVGSTGDGCPDEPRLDQP